MQNGKHHLRAGGVTPARLEIQGVPPVAVEALLDYCYKDKSVITHSPLDNDADVYHHSHFSLFHVCNTFIGHIVYDSET